MNSVKIERNGVKAEVLEKYLGDFLIDGWEKSAEPTSEVVKKINDAGSKDEIAALIKDNFDADIDKRGSLETIKEKAILIAGE